VCSMRPALRINVRCGTRLRVASPVAATVPKIRASRKISIWHAPQPAPHVPACVVAFSAPHPQQRLRPRNPRRALLRNCLRFAWLPTHTAPTSPTHTVCTWPSRGDPRDVRWAPANLWHWHEAPCAQLDQWLDEPSTREDFVDTCACFGLSITKHYGLGL
jgi:hypothetical protein